MASACSVPLTLLSTVTIVSSSISARPICMPAWTRVGHGTVRYNAVRHGMVYGMAWYGMVWHGMASYRGDQTVPFVSHQNHIAMHRVASHKHGTTWHRAALHDIAYHRIGAKTTFRFVSIRFASRITSYHAPHCTAWHGIQWRRGRDGRVFGDNSSMAKQ